MLKVEHLEVWGFQHAIRGMRNPMNSWDKSDSKFLRNHSFQDLNKAPLQHLKHHDACCYDVVCEEDLKLMKKLYSAGAEHRKFMRQIFISMDITAPLYWWKEFDTYKVGTVANSCSTMHKIHAKAFELDDFSHEHLSAHYTNTILKKVIDCLNKNREGFVNTGDKKYWWRMIQLLPSSYNQKRTITMNYENSASIVNQRAEHKQDEWREELVPILIEQLPYFKEITGRVLYSEKA